MKRKGAFMMEVLETLLANRERVRIRSVERGGLDYLHIRVTVPVVRGLKVGQTIK